MFHKFPYFSLRKNCASGHTWAARPTAPASGPCPVGRRPCWPAQQRPSSWDGPDLHLASRGDANFVYSMYDTVQYMHNVYGWMDGCMHACMHVCTYPYVHMR